MTSRRALRTGIGRCVRMLMLSTGLLFWIDREISPVLGSTAPVDPNLPIRGRTSP